MKFGNRNIYKSIIVAEVRFMDSMPFTPKALGLGGRQKIDGGVVINDIICS